MSEDVPQYGEMNEQRARLMQADDLTIYRLHQQMSANCWCMLCMKVRAKLEQSCSCCHGTRVGPVNSNFAGLPCPVCRTTDSRSP